MDPNKGLLDRGSKPDEMQISRGANNIVTQPQIIIS